MARTQWRGITTDADTAAMLDRAAQLVGQGIKLTPVAGCGSYQGNPKSAGTHLGGGAVDLDLEGYTDVQARTVETVLRSLGAAAWFRPRFSPEGRAYGWQRHLHVVRIDCRDLAPAARNQVALYTAGYDGLAPIYQRDGQPVYRRDSGSRQHVGRRWLVLSAPKPAPKPGPRTLARGSSGADVLKLQQALVRVFPDYAKRPIVAGGGPNGKFGPATEGVVRDFQKRAGVYVDGIVGPQTWAALARSGVRP